MLSIILPLMLMFANFWASQKLPLEIIQHIATFGSLVDFIKFSKTSKDLYAICWAIYSDQFYAKNTDGSYSLCLIQTFRQWKGATSEYEQERIRELMFTHPSVKPIWKAITEPGPFRYECSGKKQSGKHSGSEMFKKWLKKFHKSISNHLLSMVLEEANEITVTFSMIWSVLFLDISDSKMKLLLGAIDLMANYADHAFINTAIFRGYSYDVVALLLAKMERAKGLDTGLLDKLAQYSKRRNCCFDVSCISQQLKVKPLESTMDALMSPNNDELTVRMFIRRFPSSQFNGDHWRTAGLRGFSLDFLACMLNMVHNCVYGGSPLDQFGEDLGEDLYLAFSGKSEAVVSVLDIERAIKNNYSPSTLVYMIRNTRYTLSSQNIDVLVQQLTAKNYPQFVIDHLLSYKA